MIAAATDLDGQITSVFVNVSFLSGTLITYTIEQAAVKFVITPTANLPICTVFVTVNATDNKNSTISQTFTVKIIPLPPVELPPVVKTPDIPAMLAVTGVNSTLNVT